MTTITPTANDVLLGKGPIINTHPGNQQFRTLVNSQKYIFSTAKNKAKRSIAAQIFSDIESLQPPGRFLVEDRSRNARRAKKGSTETSNSNNIHPKLLHKRWLVVEREKALEKIMHRLRERVDADTVAEHPVEMNDEEDDVDDQCPSEEASTEQLRNHSASNSPVGDVGEVQVQEASFCGLTANLGGLDVDVKKFHVQSNSLLLDPIRVHDNRTPMEQHSIESISSNRGGIKTEGQVEGNADNSCLDEHFLDFIDSSLALVPDQQLDSGPSQQLREYTLQQWIMKSKPEVGLHTAINIHSSDEVAMYIKSTLPIALKLTECILEAEKDERNGFGNPIPLASIASENVLIRTKTSQDAVGNSTEEVETIDLVWIMSFVGDDLATGAVMSRLFALGKVLYELFTTNVLELDDDTSSSHTVSMNSISLNAEADTDYRSHKRIHWRPTHAGIRASNSITDRESSRVPWSLCALIGNLLECRHDPFCEDDAYASFADLQVDLQLMIDNPSCFLDNIHLTHVQKVIIPDKLYGRDEELSKLDEIYRIHSTRKTLTGTIISGGAGAGKSKLAMYVHKLAIKYNGFFASAKFEQNQMSLKPFSTIANLFDSLCDMLFMDSSPKKLLTIENELLNALGSQPNLLGVVPNLRKLMPSCARFENSSNNCVDSALSMRYQCGELLRVISSFSKPITIVIDDIQFAEHASLILVGSLVVSAQVCSVFFCLCHRDDDSSMSEHFNAWLNSIAMFSLESIKLESISTGAVNNLISEALHLSPRLTRPLSSVLHHKTRGNPLFLRQLLDSLTEQGYIFVDMKQRRWSWDLDKITALEISESVLALLMSDIKRLPSDLQFGLQVAACIGSCVTETMFDYLWKGLGLDLKKNLQQVAQRGFMINIAGSTKFRFSHDKIQQAAYELMPEQQRRENHMRFGLALCTQSLDNIAQDEELFFAAVNQINLGGPAAVQEPSQTNVIAELNLKAGRRSIELSDYNTAFTLFEYGISFLGDNHWLLNYQLSLDLYDAVAEAALILNELSAVTVYSNEVVLHGRCFEDKLHCLCTAAKALGMVSQHQEKSIKASFAILAQFRENRLRASGDITLRNDIDRMNIILQSTSDDMICNMQENNDKKMTILTYLYAALAHLLQYFKPWLAVSVSLRMVELTISTGLNAQSPLAFAHFGGSLITDGRITEGCRLGKLSLKLVEKKRSLQFKSRVVYFVYHNILWASKPLQMLVEAHLIGHKAGQLSGDVLYTFNNLLHAIYDDYFSGKSFDIVQKNSIDFLWKLQMQGLKIFFKLAVLLLSQIVVLREGLQMAGVAHVENMPSEAQILSDSTSGPSISVYGKIHYLSRAFLHRLIPDSELNVDISGAVAESNHQLNPHYVMGYFFEGLASFQLARQAGCNESLAWIERGQSALAKMRCWSEHSLWNWENKMLLLEAESLSMNGDFDRAGSLYDNAIRSAREHKFIHEEAIASELAGTFFCERGFRQKSYSYLLHSVACYEKWGAHAVARRVETDIRGYFGGDIDRLESNKDSSLEYLSATITENERKRQIGLIE